jgi:ectoine hydroxylase-related dioxygenase (phytanoyl-CoA dioxygenase family)
VPPLFKAVLPPELLTALRPRINASYTEVEPVPGAAPVRLPQNLPPGEKFVPTASSFTIGAILNARDLQTILNTILTNPSGEWLKRQLGHAVICNLDHSWIRRQYAPHRYPRFHAPHAWHQDGALGFDFLAYPDGNYPPDALISMVTCWIALDDCGNDAPGLELITQEQPELLSPSGLTDARIRDRFLPEHFWRPVLQPGDALLFTGEILHRTHVVPAMMHDRTSIELRFFPADDFPARLKNSRLTQI